MREKRAPGMTVELLKKATRRLQTAEPPSPRLRRASWRRLLVTQQAQPTTFRRAHWVEPVAPRLAVEKRQAQATLRRALFVLAA